MRTLREGGGGHERREGSYPLQFPPGTTLRMIRRKVVWAVALAVAAVLTAFAFHAYPTPNTDAPSFLVSAINYALGRGLVNPFYPQIAFGDPSGLHRHIYYPPAFPLMVSALMPWPTPRGAFLAVALLRVVSVGLAALLLGRVAERAARAPARDLTLLVALSLCGLATNWLPTLGRPEALATLLVLLAALAALTLEGWALVGVFGALLGGTAAAQPMGAVELALAMVLYLAARRPTRAALLESAATCALGLAVFVGVLALSPYGLRETLAGMARSYPHTPWTAPPGRDWWRPWLLSRRSTFYGPLLLASIACGLSLLRERWARLGSQPLFAAAAVLLAACFYHGSLTHKSLRNYNALVLAPLFFGVVVAWVARSAGARPAWPRAAVTACVAATAVGFFGHAAAFPWFLRHGRTLDEARAEWAAAPVPRADGVAMIGNLWTLTEDYDRLEVTPITVLSAGGPARPILLLGQRQEHHGRAPALAGFALALDLFNPKLAQDGLHRYFVPEDYSYAVYVRRP